MMCQTRSCSPVRWLRLSALPLLACLSASPWASTLQMYKGNWWTAGEANKCDSASGYAYMAEGGVLQIFNVATGSQVKRLWLNGNIGDIEWRANKLYVAAGSDGMWIYDVTTPNAPTVDYHYVPAEEAHVNQLAVGQDYVYVRVGSKIRTIRLSDKQVTNTIDTAGTAYEIYGDLDCTTNALIFTALFDDVAPPGIDDIKLVVFNLRNTASAPVYATTYDTSTTVIFGVFAEHGSHKAYLALRPGVGGSFNGIRKIDLQNPASPASNGDAATTYPPNGLAVSGNYAYVATKGDPTFDIFDGRLHIFDVSAAPASAGVYDASMNLIGVTTDMDRAVCSGANNVDDPEIKCVNVTNKAAPAGSWSYDVPAHVEGVYVVGNYQFEATGGDGLWIFDVSNPDAPVRQGNCDSGDATGQPNLAENLWVTDDGNYAVEPEGQSYTAFIDTTSKIAPTLSATRDCGGWQEGAMIVGNYAYVFSHGDPNPPYDPGDRGGGMTVLDIGNRANPTEVAWYSILTTGGANHIGDPVDGFVDANGYAYIAAESRFIILRFTAPNTIAHISTTNIQAMPGYTQTIAWDCHKSGNYVHIVSKIPGGSSSFRGVLTYNVSNPASPSLTSTYTLPNSGTEGIWADGNTVYVTAQANNPLSDDGLTALDYTNPASPTLIDTIFGPGGLNVHIKNGKIYVAGFGNGAPILYWGP